MTRTSSLFQPGQNCWRVEPATQATLIVDYANYYQAVFEAIRKAKRSIFIVGWDIDSRIEMVRGKDAEGVDCPTVFFDLIQWKARQTPGIQIYLNKWDYSLFFAREREPLAGLKWRRHSEPNVHYCLDCMLPAAACHHQKIVVIDDEIAFSGGMDIAVNRWDRREHHIEEPARCDPGGMAHAHEHIHFSPYHDIMLMVAGPAARALGEWVRERWRIATGQEPIELDYSEHPGLPETWPDSKTVHFENVPVAIARTIPAMRGNKGIGEIERMLLAEIAQAEKFIYIENQFLTRQTIARALNKRLHEKPELRVLAVSCDHPKGIMEKKSMWTWRVAFRAILEEGGVGDRAVLAHPISRENGKEDAVRIHSKLMVIDDRFLHVGSANINNRSMGFDTELDLVVAGDREDIRAKIAALRTDLIREHTGMEVEKIEHLIESGAPAEAFLNYLSTSRQHLRKINDEQYRYERFAKLVLKLADPDKPIAPGELTMPHHHVSTRRGDARRIVTLAAVVALMLAMVLAWKLTPLSQYATPSKIAPLLEEWQHTPWLFPITIGIYVISTLLFFPVMVLDISTVMAFGLPFGPMLALSGACSSAAAGFLVGHFGGPRVLEYLLGSKAKKVSKHVNKLGIAGIALLRMVPVAPFTAVNLAIGLSRTSFWVFIIGTFCGLLPGVLVFSLLRQSLFRLWHHPDLQGILFAAGGVACWAALVATTHILSRRYQARKGRDADEAKPAAGAARAVS